jgi:hypothetical protein
MSADLSKPILQVNDDSEWVQRFGLNAPAKQQELLMASEGLLELTSKTFPDTATDIQDFLSAYQDAKRRYAACSKR